MTIIDGKMVSDKIKAEIKAETESLYEKTGKRPKLVVIIVGENPASVTYVKNKERDCKKAGIEQKTIRLSESVTEAELLDIIYQLNNDISCNGFFVQLPLPAHINEEKVIDAISPKKDVDGFHTISAGSLMQGKPGFVPCTPAGIIELLKYYNIEISGKHAVIVGRSNIVGKPAAMLLLAENATVTVCHSKSRPLDKYTKEADILIAAVGKSQIIKEEYVKNGAVIVDVGTNFDTAGKMCGDVDYEKCSEKSSFITPVPGGVGPMTRAMLLKNTLTAFKNQNNLK